MDLNRKHINTYEQGCTKTNKIVPNWLQKIINQFGPTKIKIKKLAEKPHDRTQKPNPTQTKGKPPICHKNNLLNNPKRKSTTAIDRRK